MVAKLKPIQFDYKSPAGDTLSFKSDVTIDQDGTFNLVIPDEIVASAGDVRKGRENEFTLTRPQKFTRVSAPALGQAEKIVNEILRYHFRCDVRTERVILYGTDTRVAYVQDDHGVIHPNGYFTEGAFGAGRARWKGKLNATAREMHYRIGIAAFVRDKLTYVRGNSERTVFARVEDKEGEGVRLLNSFVGLSSAEGGLKEIPYTEEAARFFFDTIISMFALADRMESFFGDDKALQQAIAGQASMLLLESKAG